MIHILHIVPTLGIGGIELTLARITRGLSAPSFRHSIACLTGGAVIATQLQSAAGIHCLRGESGAVGELRRLRRLIQDLRPSVIHARNISAWIDVALVRASLLHRPPLVLSFHGTDHAGGLTFGRRIMAAIAARSATRLFTVSRPSKEFLVRALVLPGRYITIIPNGIDTMRFIPDGSGSSDHDRIVVGSVGNLLPVKNQALLVRACAALRRLAYPLELRIAGEGPEREHLLELARSLGVLDSVRLVGHVSNVPEFLQRLDIFVLSSDSEAHPNALIEAMSCGLPCVAARVGGIPDVLTDDSVGRMFDPADGAGLVKALVELIVAPETRIAVGRGARKRVEADYNLDDMIHRYAQLYTEAARR